MERELPLNSKLDCDSLDNSEERVLEPYSHQVGGRSLILTYDRSTLCKPMIPQERLFYETLPEQLMSFTPQYQGVIQVGCHTGDDGQVKLVAYPRNGLKPPDISFNNGYRPGSSICVTDDQESDEEISKVQGTTALNSSAIMDESQTMNPWTFHCQYLHLQALHEAWQDSHIPQDFILMENIARGLVHPSIMDLKMGDKGHSDYSNEEKQERQRAKCDASTSKTLGVRIAGVQVYKSASHKYTYRNKYYGFKLTKEGFKDELLQFVHNGARVRTDVLPAFIEKLENLCANINYLDGSRFYSSSLLLIYDGKEPEGNPTSQPDDSTDRSSCKVDIRMIDFGRSFHGSGKGHKVYGPDKGYLFGVESLIKLFREILRECDQRELSS